MNINIEELKEKAMTAIPGPWEWTIEKHQEFSKAFNPQIALYLIVRLQDIESERDALKAERNELSCSYHDGLASIKILCDEIDQWRELKHLFDQTSQDNSNLRYEVAALEHELEAARKQEPIGWILEKIGCRAPDDCEDYLDFHEMGEVDAEELAHYLNHGRAFQVYASPVPAQQSEALEVLSLAIDTLKTIADNCEWSHSDFPVIARAEKLLQVTPCTE